MQSRKLSLTLAKQFRTCPPPQVREDPTQGREYKRHLGVCPYCADPNSGERDAWEALAVHLARLFGEKAVPPGADEVAAPGQLRWIRPDRAMWRNGLYYNPPLVLVLETASAVSDDVLVAQTYHDIALAGPGDLILPDRHASANALFVECWNAYTLKGADLGQGLGAVNSEIVEAVKSLEKDPGAYPSWAMLPRPMTAHDPRIYFRELEVEVGYAFSSRAVSELLADLETPLLRLVYDSARALQDAVQKTLPGIGWKRPPQSREEVLALAELPVEKLPLAAAPGEEWATSANLIRIEGGRVTGIDPVRIEIHGRHGELTLDGRIVGLPQDLQNSRLICFLELEKGKPVAPRRQAWDETTGDFLVAFDCRRGIKWRLRAAVVYEPGTE